MRLVDLMKKEEEGKGIVNTSCIHTLLSSVSYIPIRGAVHLTIGRITVICGNQCFICIVFEYVSHLGNSVYTAKHKQTQTQKKLSYTFIKRREIGSSRGISYSACENARERIICGSRVDLRTPRARNSRTTTALIVSNIYLYFACRH